MGRKNPKIEYSQLYIRNEDQELCKLKKLTPNFFQFEDGTKIAREALRLNYTFYGVIDRFGFVIKYVKNGRNWAKEKIVAAYQESKWHSVAEAEKGIAIKLNELSGDSTELSFYDLEEDTNTIYAEKILRKNILNRNREMPEANYIEV